MGNQAPTAGATEPALFKHQVQLQALYEQLRHPNTLDDAFLLAEVACVCLDRLEASFEVSAEFWLSLDAASTKGLPRFLESAGCVLQHLASDLYHCVNGEVLP
jgi:hypothetical protein